MTYAEIVAKIEADAKGTFLSRCVGGIVGSRLVACLTLGVVVFVVAWRNFEQMDDTEILIRVIRWISGESKDEVHNLFDPVPPYGLRVV